MAHFVDYEEPVKTKPKQPGLTQAQIQSTKDALKGAYNGPVAPDFERIVIGANGEQVTSPSGKLSVDELSAGAPSIGAASAGAAKQSKFVDYAENSPVKNAAQYDVGNSFMGDVGNFGQGIRKGVVDTGLGIKQRFDEAANALESRFGGQSINKALGMDNADKILGDTNKVIEDRKNYYAPLSKTWAGTGGDVTGQVLATLPAAFLPGAATIKGATTIGAAQGFTAPTTGNDSVMSNTAMGAALGGTLPALFGLGRMGKKNIYDPFTQSGINKQSMDVLDAYGIKPEHLAGLESKQTITGARPSMAEQLVDPKAADGASRLQDNLATLPNQNREFSVRNMDNNEARLNTLRDVAGEGGAKANALDVRAKAAAIEYGEAYKVPFDVQRFPKSQQEDYANMMAKPAILDAMKLAEKESANRGIKFDPNTSVQSLHITKEMLDAMINKAEAQGQSIVGLTVAKKELVDAMKNISKRYDVARKGFAERSIPINQMDVGEELIKRGTSPMPDLYGNPQIRVGGLLGALKDEPALIKRATGGYGGDSLDSLLTPDQLAKVTAVSDETGRRSAVLGAGQGSGSPTAQRSVGIDLLTGAGGLATGGKMGLVRGLAKYVKGKLIEPRIQTALTDMTLNPGNARDIMAKLSQKDRGMVEEALNNKLVRQSLRSSLPALYNSERDD